jgi:hypothetical protein
MTKTIQPKKQKREVQYSEGPKARRHFEETMRTLFSAPKPGPKKPKKGKD